MKTEWMHHCLEKYFAGESSREEEQQMRAYFRKGEIDPSLRPYQAYFEALERESRQQPGDDFDRKLLEAIARERQTMPSAPTRRIRPLYAWIYRAAILLFLLAGSWWTMRQLQTPAEPATAAIDWSKYEPETPEEALRIMEQALLTTSQHMQKGARIAMEEIGALKPLAEIIQ